jgi:type I restriction enzyme R subunit
LPHWYQPGITYFVTFRTIDSVPAALMVEWQNRRHVWLREHGLSNADEVDPLPKHLRTEYHRTFSNEFLEYLDRGYGECVLRRPAFAKIVIDSLLHFDGDRYVISDAVVMPNHVHVLAALLGATALGEQCRSWKHFTAVKINRALVRVGEFWQTESFDHAVRTPAAFERFRKYIADNPRHAGLRPGESLLYSK